MIKTIIGITSILTIAYLLVVAAGLLNEIKKTIDNSKQGKK
jgi:hypothetical protein